MKLAQKIFIAIGINVLLLQTNLVLADTPCSMVVINDNVSYLTEFIGPAGNQQHYAILGPGARDSIPINGSINLKLQLTDEKGSIKGWDLDSNYAQVYATCYRGPNNAANIKGNCESHGTIKCRYPSFDTATSTGGNYQGITPADPDIANIVVGH
jgi:hypothetical protein